MKICTFELNGKPMSNFVLDGVKYPAFSGLGEHVNKRESSCMASKGPTPPGTYFIVDRQSGGIRDWLRNQNPKTSKREWFALYADDGKIDDETLCAQIMA